jgi:hypothetical protein
MGEKREREQAVENDFFNSLLDGDRSESEIVGRYDTARG